MSKQVIHISNEEFFQLVADYLIKQLNKFVQKQARCRFVLSGGNTPLGIFEQLVERQAEVDWDCVELFWLDERCVEIESGESNFGMAKRHFIDLLTIKPSFFPMYSGGGIEEAAKQYQELILSELPTGSDIPSFDLALVGVGADGHVASLFPGSQMLHEAQKLIASENIAGLNSPRMSMTLPIINRIKHAVVVLRGEEKSWVIDACAKDSHLPICQVALEQGEMVWFVC